MNVLLISLDKIRQMSDIDSNISDDMLQRTLIEVQDMMLRPVIGRPLLNTVYTAVGAGNVSDLHKDLIENRLQKLICAGIEYRIIFKLNFQLLNKGVTKQKGKNDETLSKEEITRLQKEKLEKFNFYATDLRKYLLYHSTEFPEYFYVDPDTGVVDSQGGEPFFGIHMPDEVFESGKGDLESLYWRNIE